MTDEQAIDQMSCAVAQVAKTHMRAQLLRMKSKDGTLNAREILSSYPSGKKITFADFLAILALDGSHLIPRGKAIILEMKEEGKLVFDDEGLITIL